MRRYLVVANQTLGANELYYEGTGVLGVWSVYVPHRRAGDPADRAPQVDGGGGACAGSRSAGTSSFWFRELPATVNGEVGDANPLLAIWDVLRAGQFDHIILSTLPPGLSRWLKMDLPTRVKTTFDLPVTDVVSNLSREETRP